MPEIEEREAARFGGYTWKEWVNEFSLLTPEGRYERAAGVAHYRLNHLITSHTEDAVNNKIKQQSARGA